MIARDKRLSSRMETAYHEISRGSNWPCGGKHSARGDYLSTLHRNEPLRLATLPKSPLHTPITPYFYSFFISSQSLLCGDAKVYNSIRIQIRFCTVWRCICIGLIGLLDPSMNARCMLHESSPMLTHAVLEFLQNFTSGRAAQRSLSLHRLVHCSATTDEIEALLP